MRSHLYDGIGSACPKLRPHFSQNLLSLIDLPHGPPLPGHAIKIPSSNLKLKKKLLNQQINYRRIPQTNYVNEKCLVWYYLLP